MATSSRKEIRDRVIDVAKQLDTQKGSLVNELINLTIMEIQSPSWAFESGEANHFWNFNKRARTLTTTANTADYILSSDVDAVSTLRQTETDTTIKELTQNNFYDHVPDPAAAGTGTPEFYVINSVRGTSALMTENEKLAVRSDSAADDGDPDLIVTIHGYSSGLLVTETFILDGTTYSVGSITYDYSRPIFVSKSKDTVGTVSVVSQIHGTRVIYLTPQDRAPIYKVMTLYPTPDSAISLYLNYFTSLRPLSSDGDAPGFDEKWHHAVFWGTLSKVYMHLGKETDYAFAFGVYKKVVLSMIQADRDKPNLVEQLRRHQSDRLRKSGFIVKATDAVIV
jgi:hypothetical protein